MGIIIALILVVLGIAFLPFIMLFLQGLVVVLFSLPIIALKALLGIKDEPAAVVAETKK